MRKESALNQSNDEMQSLFLLEDHRLKTQVKLHTGVYGKSRREVRSKCRQHARKAAASPGFTSAGCLRGEGAGSPARRASPQSASTPRVQSQRPMPPWVSTEMRLQVRQDPVLGQDSDQRGLPPPPTAATASVCTARSPPARTAAPGAPRAHACVDKAPPLHLGAADTGRGPSAGQEPLSQEAGGLASPADTHTAKERPHRQPFCSP